MLDNYLNEVLRGWSTYPDDSIGHLLQSLAWGKRAKRVCEIGFFVGYSASWICSGIKKHGEPAARMVSVDYRPCNYWSPNGCGLLKDQGFHFHTFVEGNSSEATTVDAVAKNLDGSIDFLFIDGDHEGNQPYLDWIAYSPLVEKGGWVLWHDCYHPPVKEAMMKSGLHYINLGGHAELSLGVKV